MGQIVKQPDLRLIHLGGPPTSKATGTLASNTLSLFTVTGGMVVVTSLVGKVNTAITTAGGTYKLQVAPTTGDTVDLTASVDLGTVNTAAGDLLIPNGSLGFDKSVGSFKPFVLDIGTIQHVSTITAGAITWYATWFEYQDGGTLAAA